MLVAPAIVALWAGPPPGARGDSMATGLAVVEEVVSAQDAPEVSSRQSAHLESSWRRREVGVEA